MSIHRVTTEFGGSVQGGGFNTLYFLGPGGASESNQTVVDFWTALQPSMANDVTWNVLPEVVQIDEATGNVEAIEEGPGGSGTGTDVSEQLSFTTQGLMRFTTEGIVNNRIVRGRIFVPGPTEPDNDNGRPSAVHQQALEDAVTNTLRSVAQSDTNPLVVWARPFTPEPGDDAEPRAGSRHIVVSHSAWTEWAVLRSRRD